MKIVPPRFSSSFDTDHHVIRLDHRIDVFTGDEAGFFGGVLGDRGGDGLPADVDFKISYASSPALATQIENALQLTCLFPLIPTGWISRSRR